MFLVQFYSIITCRDVSKFMKERNILGSSRGYLDRIIESYSAVTVTNVRKYFLSTLKFSRLYLSGKLGTRSTR